MDGRKLLGWLKACNCFLRGKHRVALKRFNFPKQILSFYAHDPDPEMLGKVLAWLAAHGFTFVSTAMIEEMTLDGTRCFPRMAWFTVDDVYEGFEARILPVLARYHCPATLFVAPNETQRGEVWTSAIRDQVTPGELEQMFAMDLSDRYARVQALSEGVRSTGRPLASVDELKRVARHPLITLESKTFTNLSVPSRPREELEQEIEQAGACIHAWTGRTPRCLCYPFGHWCQADDLWLAQHNLIPVHSDPGPMSVSTFGIYRNAMADTMSFAENLCRILDLWPRHDPPRRTT